MPVKHHISWHSAKHPPANIRQQVAHKSVHHLSHILYHPPPPRGTKCLDRKVFALLHFSLIVVLHQQHRLVAMDFVKFDRVATEILNRLD